MDKKNDTHMIYLKDLLFTALHHWRSVLAVALALAFILGGAKAVSGLSALNADSEPVSSSYSVALEKYETEKSSLEQQVRLLLTSIENQNDYLTHSVLMQLDPFGFYEAGLTVYADTDYHILPQMQYQNPNMTSSVLTGYKTALCGSQTVQLLADATSIPYEYVSELITIAISEETDALIINARHFDAEGAQKMIDLIAEHIQTMQPDIASAVAEHQVQTVIRNATPQTDSDLLTTQKAEMDRLTTMLNTLKTVQEKQTALTPPTAEDASVSGTIKNAVVFFVIGGILGALLSVAFYWVAYIASDRVYSARTLANRCGIKVLGCISGTPRKRHLDHWLRKLEGRSVNDIDKQAALLAINIRNRCRETKHLLVVSDTKQDAKEQIVQALRNTLSGIRLDDCGSLLQDATALEVLADCDTVLLIEQCGHSLYSHVEQETKIICDCGKQLIGCVLLDG